MQVYAVTGAEPEIQAYAMAKYSRSAQSLRESIRELSAQRAEEFLNTFYFQYGHRSIADLAHVALAIEDISMLAAIAVVDEPVWDGQERSSRYQDFRRSGYHVPPTFGEEPAARTYHSACDALLTGYHTLTRDVLGCLLESYPVPRGGDEAAHKRTLRARAFDISRYLLPLASRTSVGQITSARVLERQISRLKGSTLPEVRTIGEAMKVACRETPFEAGRGGAVAAPEDALAAAPTLVRYAEASAFEQDVERQFQHLAKQYLGDMVAEPGRGVELVDLGTLETEMAASLLYRYDRGGHSYAQWRELVEGLSGSERRDLIDHSLAGRGPHDAWLRGHQSSGKIAFDITIDVGAFRDFHRHRRCTQLIQPFSDVHGFDDPEQLLLVGLQEAAPAALNQGLHMYMSKRLAAAWGAFRALRADLHEEALYVLPLATRVRALFKMDIAQAAYMIELRTGEGGHFAYRHAAWQMYEQLQVAHPAFARHIRATDPRIPFDMLKR